MVTYSEIKNNINTLRREILKYLYVETIDRRRQILDSVRSDITTLLQAIQNEIAVKTYELAFGLALERYKSSQITQVGKKSIGFTYADDTIDMTGLDGNVYDNPLFPQIQLTSDELNELNTALKDVPAEVRRGICTIRVKVEDEGKIDDTPDEEDSLFAYYFADSVNPIEHHAVDYGGEIFGADIFLKGFFYETIDPLIGGIVEYKLEKVESESLILGWFWNDEQSRFDITIGVDIKPLLTISDPSNTDNKRVTTAMFVLNVYNYIDVDGSILVDRFEVPLKASKHYLVVIGAEIQGLRGICIPIEQSL